LSKKELDHEVVVGLEKSFKILRPVYPIVKAEDGEILDGDHRKEAAPITYEKYCVVLKGVTSEKDKLLYKLHLNYRREVPKKEREKHLTRLAEILEGEGVPRQEMVSALAKITPFTDRYIRELLPEKYKYVEKAPPHAELPPHTKIVTPPTIIKPSWEERKAVMKAPISKMELEVITELMAEGLSLEMNREFCLESTIPDAYHSDKNLAIFIDGEVHMGKEDRDERLRELLQKRYGCKILVVRYKEYSKLAKEEIKQKIKEAISE